MLLTNSSDLHLKQLPLVSILINNYNYSRFIKEAIDSALNQTYTQVEVIVVDDGSTDKSQDIISSYEDKIIPVLKKNGGQASAFNAGFEASNGKIIIFLDADDVFLPDKVEKIVNLFEKITIDNLNVTIYHNLQATNEYGSHIELDILSSLCESKDLREISGSNNYINGVLTKVSTAENVCKFAKKYRFIPYLASPTSALAMTRSLAEEIFPLSTEGVRTSADDFLVKAASLLGDIYFADTTLSEYRIHGANNWFGQNRVMSKDFLEKVDSFLNDKLITNGKQPVFSYFNSIHARSYYREFYQSSYSDEMFNLAFKVIAWHLNLRTFIFWLKIMVWAIYFQLGLGGKSGSGKAERLS